MLNANSAVPLYQQVAEDIRNRITSGEYSPGQALPSESRLCELYNVSRITIRNAIADLVEQDLLVTHHGKGTFVQTPKISSSLNTFKGFTVFCHENNINAYTHMLGMNRQKPNTAIMKKLELTPEDDVVYLKRLRHVNDKPVMIEHVSLPCSQFEFLLDVDMEDQSLYEVIERRTGMRLEDNCYTSITLETSIATEEEAQLLKFDSPQSVFVLMETVITHTGIPVHYTKQILSGRHFKFFLSNKVNQLSMNWSEV